MDTIKTTEQDRALILASLSDWGVKTHSDLKGRHAWMSDENIQACLDMLVVEGKALRVEMEDSWFGKWSAYKLPQKKYGKWRKGMWA